MVYTLNLFTVSNPMVVTIVEIIKTDFKLKKKQIFL